MYRNNVLILSGAAVLLAGCSRDASRVTRPAEPAPDIQAVFKVDPATAGTLTGKVRFSGPKPARKLVEMDSEPECSRLHANGRVSDETLIVNSGGAFPNVFVYLKTGIEGKKFEVPATPVTIDQKGCWFQPRVLGIQTGQTLRVTNSDPVTHNIHPLAKLNREWNQSQSEGDPPLMRRFVRPEILMPVKCNIHRWMRAFIGVVDHPYFAVTKADGSFEIDSIPPGTYTLAAVHDVAGAKEQSVTVKGPGKVRAEFLFEGE